MIGHILVKHDMQEMMLVWIRSLTLGGAKKDRIVDQATNSIRVDWPVALIHAADSIQRIRIIGTLAHLGIAFEYLDGATNKDATTGPLATALI